MRPADSKRIALQFNEQLTAQHIDGLAALMTTDHRFIDRDGQVTAGKAAMIDAWRRFFVLFPDYVNTFTRVEAQGELVVLYGYATWETGGAPDFAIWTARVEGGLVAEWRIVTDNEENRSMLGLGEGND
jgi:predicted SnoaL-like aldol condensation-catalyzing enzyme